MSFQARFLRPVLLTGTALALCAAAATLAPASQKPVRLPAPSASASAPTSSAVLAGGCFWGLQGLFEHVKGVRRVVAGYAGGEAGTAQYEMVGTGRTGHAESVKIEFDPALISYGQILQLFFSAAHDPTQVGGQGPDNGSQYRSAIFYANEAEKSAAEAYMAQLDQAHAFNEPLATKLEPLRGFYPAEGYHQDYLIHNPDSMYIVINDLPKITALRNLYPELYRAKAVTVDGAESRS